MPEPLPRPHALEQWRTEIASGARRNDGEHFDTLHAAACWEKIGLERLSARDVRGAQDYFDTALLRLYSCHGRPNDGTKKDPGPGRLLWGRLETGERPPIRYSDLAAAYLRSRLEPAEMVGVAI